MASETNLGTVHIFPSESSYNANKNQIGIDDIAFVPYTLPIASSSRLGAVKLGTGFSINSNGVMTFTGVANSAKYSDYAEWFPRGCETSEGDIIALDEVAAEEKYIKATCEHRCVVGVHSESYAFCLGGKDIPPEANPRECLKEEFIPVGLMGRVPVKFVGKALKGRKVVPSQIPGVGKALETDAELVIGYLVEQDDREDIRLLKMKLA